MQWRTTRARMRSRRDEWRRVYTRVVIRLCQTLCDPSDSSLQAALSVQISRQEHCRVLPFPTPGYLFNPGSKLCLLCLLHLQVESLPTVPSGKPKIIKSKIPFWKNLEHDCWILFLTVMVRCCFRGEGVELHFIRVSFRNWQHSPVRQPSSSWIERQKDQSYSRWVISLCVCVCVWFFVVVVCSFVYFTCIHAFLDSFPI